MREKYGIYLIPVWFPKSGCYPCARTLANDVVAGNSNRRSASDFRWWRFAFTFGEILSNIAKMMKTGKNESSRSVAKSLRHVTVFSFLDAQIAWLQTVGRNGTAQNYQRARNSFALYRCGRDIPLQSVTSELICDYESWLKQRPVTRNTVSFYMRILRSVYNKAVERGLVSPSTPFKYVYTGIEKTRKLAVDEGTVVRLRQLDLSGRPSLCFARDLFLFSFYCRGMAFVDMAYLRKSNVHGGLLTYARRKTGQLLHIRVEECMQRIIAQYTPLACSEYLFPIIDSLDPNRAYLSYRSALSYYNKHLKELSALLGLERRLSSYVARHTWATVARKMQIPVTIISEGLGHRSEQTTRIYLASLEQSVIDNANRRILQGLYL